MPATAGTLVNTVLQRVYDASGIATTQAQVLDLLSRCQLLLNAQFNSILVTATFPTGPRQQVFSLADFATDVLRVRSVRDQNRDLSEVPFRQLKYISSRWFGESGSRWESFARLGRTMIVVHPMKQSASSITLVYTQILPLLTSRDDICPLPNDQIPLLTKMVEALILLRQRNFDGVKIILAELKKSGTEIAEEVPGERSA